jgi:hypothetical protein
MRIFAAAAGAVVPVVAALAVAAPFSSREPAAGAGPVPVLVELFTSEGCSSCPPADELLIDLAASQPIPGATVIGLSEHVDYWNRLGWVDPFSHAIFTERQNAYAQAARTNSIYTPQAVVDGHLALVGSDRASLTAAIRRAAGRPKAAVAIGVSSGGDDNRRVSIAIAADEAVGDANVYLALTENDLVTAVRRGENAGRHLRHVAVTRRLTEIGRTAKDGSFERTMDVVLHGDWSPAALHVVVFAQRSAGRVLALGTAPLPR